jgi:excisionase family DNA binding protein
MTHWMTTRQACEYTGYSASTLARWRSAGLVCSRPGRCYRYKRADLDDFIEAHQMLQTLTRHDCLEPALEAIRRYRMAS